MPNNCPNTANADQADLDTFGWRCMWWWPWWWWGVECWWCFPDDATESLDTDNDGVGNNADTDDDNDGYSDADETQCASNPLDQTSVPSDADADFIPDCVEQVTDADLDGILNDDDNCPNTANADQSDDTDDRRCMWWRPWWW